MKRHKEIFHFIIIIDISLIILYIKIMKYNPYNQIWVITWRAGTVLQYIFYGIHGPVFIIFLKIKILKCVLTGYSTIAPFVIFHVPTNSNSSIGNFETYKKSSKSCGPKMPYGWKLPFIIILVRIPSIFEGGCFTLVLLYFFFVTTPSLSHLRKKQVQGHCEEQNTGCCRRVTPLNNAQCIKTSKWCSTPTQVPKA